MSTISKKAAKAIKVKSGVKAGGKPCLLCGILVKGTA